MMTSTEKNQKTNMQISVMTCKERGDALCVRLLPSLPTSEMSRAPMDKFQMENGTCPRVSGKGRATKCKVERLVTW
ncbi:hypothetical protein GBAR_LOCUS3509, partial [Geodia barretti]